MNAANVHIGRHRTCALLVCSVLLVLQRPLNVHAAPIVWSGPGGNGHAYESVPEPLTWEAARAAANGMSYLGFSGHLATVTSQAENDFITANFPNPQFLGGFQLDGSVEPNGGWTWLTGEPWAYTNWAAGEPNNLSGTEKYLEFFAGGPKWNDISGNDLRTYVVEYETPEPSTAVLAAIGCVGLVMWSRRHLRLADQRHTKVLARSE